MTTLSNTLISSEGFEFDLYCSELAERVAVYCSSRSQAPSLKSCKHKYQLLNSAPEVTGLPKSYSRFTNLCNAFVFHNRSHTTHSYPWICPVGYIPVEARSKTSWSFHSSYSTKWTISGAKIVGEGKSKVKLVKCKKTGKLMACKTFRVYKTRTARDIANELLIGQKLDHENVLGAQDLVHDRIGRWCLLIDYCDGICLEQLMLGYRRNSVQGVMPRIERECLFKQLLTGVNYLHSIGVAHRDLKPRNIMVSKSGMLQIIDFDAAVDISEHIREFGNTMTPLVYGMYGNSMYMAPEMYMYRGKVGYDPRGCDIWACALIYYTMLTFSIFFNVADATTDEFYVDFLSRLEKFWCRELNMALFLNEPESETLSRLHLDVVRSAFPAVHDAETSSTTLASSTSFAVSYSSKQKIGNELRSELITTECPFYVLDDLGLALKKLLVQMLSPNPNMRPKIHEIMANVGVRRMRTCKEPVWNLSKGHDINSPEFKKCVRKREQTYAKHSHIPPRKHPNMLGMKLKEPHNVNIIIG